MNNEELRVVVVAVMPWFCLISTLELWAREHAGILTTQEHDEVIPLDRALGANNMIGSDSPLAHWERTHVLGSWKKSSGLQWSPKMMKSLSFDPDWTCQKNDFWIFKKRYKAAWMIKCTFFFPFQKMFCDKTEEIFLHLHHLYTLCIFFFFFKVKWINELEQRHGNYSIIPFIINFSMWHANNIIAWNIYF